MMSTVCHILYWFRGLSQIPDSYLPRFIESSRAANTPGPGDGRGMLIAPVANRIPRYLPEQQRWDRLSEAVWVGCSLSATPETFRRPDGYGGIPIEMGDGNAWVIPVINPMVASCQLPTWDVLTDGQWTQSVQERYADLAGRAAALAADVRAAVIETGTRQIEIDDGDLRQLVADALALNYYLTVEEMSVLRLFDPDCYWPVVHAMIDTDAMFTDLQQMIDTGAANASAPFGDSRAAVTNSIELGVRD